MKSKLLALLLIVLCLFSISSIMGQSDEQPIDDSDISVDVLVVWQNDSSCVSYYLEDNPVTTFSGDNLVITTTKIRVEFPVAKIKRYTYSPISTDITIPITNNTNIKQSDNELIICNLPQGKYAYVYTVDGKLISSIQSLGEELIRISMESFSEGYYVIKAEKITYKFMKK